MLFNIYYLNFSKVYEIKMMLSNVIKTDETIEKNQENTVDAGLEAKIGIKSFGLFKTVLGADVKAESSDSQKVLENFKITMTKSLILNEVIEKCKIASSGFEGVTEGQLIRVDNVSLLLENEMELRTVKMFSNGMFKGMRSSDTGGLDVNNVLNSMFKDYSYKLKGELQGSDEKLLIKIPLTFENEFENSYNVDDLFVGNVSIIGIYKGKTKIHSLKNSFDYFSEIGEDLNDESDSDIHESQYPISQETKLEIEIDNEDYNYIDLLAIVQVIKSDSYDDESKYKKPRKKGV